MNAENTLRKAAEIRQQTRELVIGFLRVEVDVSLTFAKAALNSNDDPDKRTRNQATARKGYDTIHRYLEKFPFPPDPAFKNTLERLKAVLQDLGETGLPDYEGQHP